MSSLFYIILMLFHVALAYVAVDTTTAVYNCSLSQVPVVCGQGSQISVCCWVV